MAAPPPAPKAPEIASTESSTLTARPVVRTNDVARSERTREPVQPAEDQTVQRDNQLLQPLAAIGVSLGGNVLLKWLGEQAGHADITTAIAISVPLDLHEAAVKLGNGASRIYQHHLLKRLRDSVTIKATRHEPPFPLDRLDELDSFHKFDNEVTAPLHGFRDVDDYYARSSSKQFLKRIEVPTLLLQAADDPFLPPEALPKSDELGPAVTLELARHGGHVGFVTGGNPFKPRYWLEERALHHLKRHRQ